VAVEVEDVLARVVEGVLVTVAVELVVDVPGSVR
jgi:hypothetical protein